MFTRDRARWLTLLLVLGGGTGALAQVVAQPQSLGRVQLTFANGAEAQLLPMVHGPEWEPTLPHQALMAADTDTNQVSVYPVRGLAQPTDVTVTRRLWTVPAEPNTLHFRYAFEVEQALTTRRVSLVLSLPTANFAGEAMTSDFGADLPETLPVQVDEQYPLLGIGEHQQVDLAAGQPTALSLRLADRRWIVVGDNRAYGTDEFHLYLVAGPLFDRSELAPGQPVVIEGSLTLAAPVRLVEPEPEPARVAVEGLGPVFWDLSRPLTQTLAGIRGRWLGTFELFGVAPDGTYLRAEAPATAAAPGLQAQTDDHTVTGRVPAGDGAFTVQQTSSLDGNALVLTTAVENNTAVATGGVAVQAVLPAEFFAGQRLRFQRDGAPSVLLQDEPGLLGRARADGIVIEDAAGRELLVTTSNRETVWEAVQVDAYYLVRAWVVDAGADQLVMVEPGERQTLTLRIAWSAARGGSAAEPQQPTATPDR